MLKVEYSKQINRVVDYILMNLRQPLDLKHLAEIAGLSAYHFHRLFTSELGETPAKYIQRRRLEKAAALLQGDERIPILNVAYDCGFNSANVFSRNFKKHFGMTAEEYRCNISQSNSKNRPSNSNKEEFVRSYSSYFCPRKTIKIGDYKMDCTFEIKKMPAFNIIYCRHLGAFNEMQDAFAKLMQWAYPRGLINAPGAKLLSVYHDNPDITDKSKLTSDAGLIVSEKIKTDGDIGQYEITGGLYAVGRFEIGMDEFPDAWHAMFDLVKEHGCQCTNAHHYELYQNNIEEHPQKKWIVDICIPVKMN
ncbi:AraC family transcriptional regulator [uncultured Bacteroides sp.]|uniref:AraC family transcriptional regulator n=1 Tax=uncultured Bacteroides sp. TaxID=162156 RepID=UPI002AABC061|nr:AraC family transcriptional regulator [uncultured Bacteroides sp.]